MKCQATIGRFAIWLPFAGRDVDANCPDVGEPPTQALAGQHRQFAFDHAAGAERAAYSELAGFDRFESVLAPLAA